MPSSQPHSIRSQVLEVEVAASEADALALQRRLPDLCARALAPAIEQVLERCAPAQGFLCIDRIELDAGTLEWSRFDTDLPRAVMLALERAVRELMAVAAAPHDAAANPGQRAARHRSSRQTLDEALAYFLKNGSLPSSFHLEQGGPGFEQALLAGWREAAPAGSSAPGGSAILMRALADPACRERLTRQFSASLLAALLGMLHPQGSRAMNAVLAVVRNERLPAADSALLERQVWIGAFERIAGGRDLDAPRLLREAFDRLEIDCGLAADPLRPSGARSFDPPEADRRRRAATQRAPIDTVAAEQRHLVSAPHPDADTGIFVGDAGLVLLHPFLPALFEGLALSAGERLLAPERALHLLHYLATGQDCAPEYELPLAKILCELPLTQAVHANLALSTAEKDQAQALLDAVIGHWSALRNTGVDGLRAAFLLRRGKLSRRDGDWLLQVEPDTADILLDQLPWGISPIKLAWMEPMLWVEWG
jgi:hypothetical protein